MSSTKMQMATRPKVLAKRMLLAQALADANGGFLPGSWTLIQGGHQGLYRYINRHNELFRHLIQPVVGDKNKTCRNLRIANLHLKTAKKLYAKFGHLPSSNWLKKNGYSKLASYIKQHPDVFGGMGILDDRLGKSNGTSYNRKIG